MHKRKQWIVAAGLALCGLLLAALTLGRPRDVPETSRDSAPWPVCGWSPPGTASRRKETCTDPAGRECNLLKIVHKIIQMQKNGHLN